jgi:hypothetical protein
MQQSHKLSRQLPTEARPMKTGNPISLYTGVTWDKSMNKWRSSITRDKKTKHLGSFDKESDASIAYDEAAERHIRLKKSDLVG